MKNIFNFFKKDDIGNPPWDYNFLTNLDESEYPVYLAKLFKLRTGEELPLLKEWSFKSGILSYKIDKKKLKTFNQKIQWIKLYEITPLMRDCTDKVKVRDFVHEKIGDEYLKPVLQVVNNEELEVRSNNLTANSSLLTTNLFDKVDFEKLPNAFVIKCNHGCKWQYIIKNKRNYLNSKQLIDLTKQQIIGWLEQEFWVFEGFELQYKGIKPKILIEPLMRDNINCKNAQIQVYCFNGVVKYIIKIYDNKVTIWDENLNFTDDILGFNEEKINLNADELIYQTFDLSVKLLTNSNFKFVRVDWMIYKNKPYFEELTFTPYSGFLKTVNQKTNQKLGNLLCLD